MHEHYSSTQTHDLSNFTLQQYKEYFNWLQQEREKIARTKTNHAEWGRLTVLQNQLKAVAGAYALSPAVLGRAVQR